MQTHRYRVVQKHAASLIKPAGLRWHQRVAWLRLSGLALSLATWTAVFLVMRP